MSKKKIVFKKDDDEFLYDGEPLTKRQRHKLEKLPEYKACLKCNQLIKQIDYEITVWYKTSDLPVWRPTCDHCLKKIRKDLNEIKKRYGDPPPDYRCPVCKKDSEQILKERPKKQLTKNPFRSCWSWDHNHETGKFRGWTCQECNRALGEFGDNVAILENAIAYLTDGNRNQ